MNDKTEKPAVQASLTGGVDIDVDQLEATVEQWDSTIRRASILGRSVAVDPGMQNLIEAGREYARLWRDSE